jgi:hypothetical protein
MQHTNSLVQYKFEKLGVFQNYLDLNITQPPSKSIFEYKQGTNFDS